MESFIDCISKYVLYICRCLYFIHYIHEMDLTF